MNERIRQIIVIISTLAVVYVNYLAGTGQINHTSPKDVSDKYINFLTPAGYAFSIWGLIYFGLIIFSIYQALPSQTLNVKFQKIRTLYIANCAANIAWLFSWHYDQILVSIILMLVIIFTLILINRILFLINGDESTSGKWLSRIPFGIYFGWITAATILNATIALIYAGIRFPYLASIITACILIAAAAVLAILVRRGFDNVFYPLTIAWALIAIAVNQKPETAIFAAAIIAAAVSALSVFLPKKTLLKSDE